MYDDDAIGRFWVHTDDGVDEIWMTPDDPLANVSQVDNSYRVGGSAITFTTANHHVTSDSNGKAVLEKKGAGPVSRVPSDPFVVGLNNFHR
jgi:hypothetical protein